MRRNHWIYSFFVLFLGVWISGCAVRPIATSTIGAIDSKERLLIATQDSEFKDTVVSNVIKEFEKEKVISEDELRRGEEDLQKITDRHIELTDKAVEKKEKEIMEV